MSQKLWLKVKLQNLIDEKNFLPHLIGKFLPIYVSLFFKSTNLIWAIPKIELKREFIPSSSHPFRHIRRSYPFIQTICTCRKKSLPIFPIDRMNFVNLITGWANDVKELIFLKRMIFIMLVLRIGPILEQNLHFDFRLSKNFTRIYEVFKI